MSVLRSEIYPAIAALELELAGVTVTGYGLDQLPNSVVAAMLPCRVLSPFTNNAGGNIQRWVTLERNKVVDWQLTDLLLARGAAAGLGLVDIAEPLTEYLERYIDAMRTLRTFARWKVISVDAKVDMIEWPESSGQWYDGVRSQLTIRELQ